MTDPALIERITRSLAFMLRHQPETFDLELDPHGYSDLEDVVQALNERLGEPVEEEDVRIAVQSGDRPRYEIVDDRIRALYGHSIPIEPGPSTKPPEFLYVAVPEQELERARRFGLRGGRRRFLHLAVTQEDAAESGRRAARDYTVLIVHALDAWEEGISFYDRTALWLAEEVPTHLLEVEGTYHDGTDPMPRRFDGGQERGGGRERGRERGGRGRGRDRGRHGGRRDGRGHEGRGHDAGPRRGDSERGGFRREEEFTEAAPGGGERGRYEGEPRREGHVEAPRREFREPARESARDSGREPARDPYRERDGERFPERREARFDERPRGERPERRFERAESGGDPRPERGGERHAAERGGRFERGGRPERPESFEHGARSERGEGFGRGERERPGDARHEVPDAVRTESRPPREARPEPQAPRTRPPERAGGGFGAGVEPREESRPAERRAPPPPPPPPARREPPPVASDGPGFGAGI